MAFELAEVRTSTRSFSAPKNGHFGSPRVLIVSKGWLAALVFESGWGQEGGRPSSFDVVKGQARNTA